MRHGGWYNRKDNSLTQLVDIHFIAPMGPPGGGRARITQRYVRYFNLINFVPFEISFSEPFLLGLRTGFC